MHRFFSKVSRRKRLLSPKKIQTIQELKEYFSDVFAGHKIEPSELDISDLFGIPITKTEQLLTRINEIERRLTTLELNPILLQKDGENQR